MADAVEKSGGGRARLVSELGRVQDLVRQLEQQLRAPADAASVDLCRRLVHQIVALTDRSIGMLHASPDLLLAALPSPAPPAAPSPSPIGAAAADHNHPFASSPKKRKATARWTSQQVRVSAAGAGAGAEGPADDGHSWRKYGQKDILGAKHPRAYYRCTHRNSQGCPATKQVQRTDGDPALFDVVYHGEHTCNPNKKAQAQQQHNPNAHAALQGLAARLTVATTAITDAAAARAPMTPESCPALRGASSPWSLASASPVGSDSNGGGLHQGVSVSPCPVVSGYGDCWASEGDLQEVVSSAFAAAVSSAAPMPVLHDEFMSFECFAFDEHTFGIDAAMPSLYYP